MKAILEYMLPDEEEEFRIAIRAMHYRHTLQGVDQSLRDRIKYDLPLGKEERTFLEGLRTNIRESLLEDIL